MKGGVLAAYIIASIIGFVVLVRLALYYILYSPKQKSCSFGCLPGLRRARTTDSGDIELNADPEVAGERAPDLALPAASHKSDRDSQRI